MRAAASDISLVAVTQPKSAPATEGSSAICRALSGGGGPCTYAPPRAPDYGQ